MIQVQWCLYRAASCVVSDTIACLYIMGSPRQVDVCDILADNVCTNLTLKSRKYSERFHDFLHLARSLNIDVVLAYILYCSRFSKHVKFVSFIILVENIHICKKYVVPQNIVICRVFSFNTCLDDTTKVIIF